MTSKYSQNNNNQKVINNKSVWGVSQWSISFATCTCTHFVVNTVNTESFGVVKSNTIKPQFTYVMIVTVDKLRFHQKVSSFWIQGRILSTYLDIHASFLLGKVVFLSMNEDFTPGTVDNLSENVIFKCIRSGSCLTKIKKQFSTTMTSKNRSKRPFLQRWPAVITSGKDGNSETGWYVAVLKNYWDPNPHKCV